MQRRGIAHGRIRRARQQVIALGVGAVPHDRTARKTRQLRGASAEDFLTRIGAPHAAMELMQAKVEKNLRNTINRQVNCETANMMKNMPGWIWSISVKE